MENLKQRLQRQGAKSKQGGWRAGRTNVTVKKTAKRSDGARTRTYQTDAGDAGVVGDVGDVQDFSFVVAAGRCTCEGRQERCERQASSC